MAFGNIDSPPVTDFGAIRNPTGQGSCCMATRTLDIDIKLLVDTLEVEPWYSPAIKYSVDAEISAQVGWSKECIDASGLDCSEFNQLKNIGYGDYSLLVYPGGHTWTAGPPMKKVFNFRIIDVNLDFCGPCNPGTQGTYSSGDPSECDCPHENKEAFPPFTIKLSSPSCKKGWGKAVKEQAAAAINNALKNVQVGGCACSNCEECMPYGELNSKIMTVGEAFSAAINALGQLYRKQSSGRGPGGLSAINAGFIKQFDEEPNLCP